MRLKIAGLDKPASKSHRDENQIFSIFPQKIKRLFFGEFVNIFRKK